MQSISLFTAINIFKNAVTIGSIIFSILSIILSVFEYLCQKSSSTDPAVLEAVTINKNVELSHMNGSDNIAKLEQSVPHSPHVEIKYQNSSADKPSPVLQCDANINNDGQTVTGDINNGEASGSLSYVIQTQDQTIGEAGNVA